MIVGIDLGTTNSAISVWRDGKAELIPNSLGHFLTPSAVSVDESGAILVGLAARERQSTHPTQTATIFKRYMGSQRKTTLGKNSYLPEELSAMVLRSLKADAEAYLGQAVTEAVITVPAYFNDKQRRTTRRAGEFAGLKVERLLNEPTAAALAYGIHQLDNESKFLVFDLGGGTFDISILEIFEGIIEVRATTGDNRLGGEDFNDILIDWMRSSFEGQLKSKADQGGLLMQRLRVAAEQTRRALSDLPSATMRVIHQDRLYEKLMTAEDFEERVAPLIDRLREPVLRSLRDSGIHPDSLKEIVLVGGATRMPVIRRAIARMFGRFPTFTVHPDEAVALGAAVQAGLKARNADLKEITITDVCPHSLGVGTTEKGPNGIFRQGVFAPIIERNTVVPASRVRQFFTIRDGQPVVTFDVYQGESRLVHDNIQLGTISMPVPPKPAGQVKVDCRFSYDINGLIEVDVYNAETGVHRQIVIVDSDDISTEELLARRQELEKIKLHPREADANRAALARAERCYEDSLGEKRAYVDMLIRRFEVALDGQNPREVELARKALLSELYQPWMKMTLQGGFPFGVNSDSMSGDYDSRRELWAWVRRSGSHAWI